MRARTEKSREVAFFPVFRPTRNFILDRPDSDHPQRWWGYITTR